MKSRNIIFISTAASFLLLFSACIKEEAPIGVEIIGDYEVTYTYVVYNDPWEGGGSDTIVRLDTTFRIELANEAGDLIIGTTPRFSNVIVPGIYRNDSLIIPRYDFYPPGLTSHSMQGEATFIGDSIYVYLGESISEWPQGGSNYQMYGKGIRR